jgi:sec-independent protein translocase protein TatB
METQLTIEAANLGMADSLILMLMALVVFGPRRLPQIGRQIGKLMYEFRKASNDFKFQMEEELRNAEEADRRKKEEEERQRQLALNPPAATVAVETASADTAATEPAAESNDPYSSYSEIVKEQEQAGQPNPSIQPPSTGEPVPAQWTPESAATETPAPEPHTAGSATVEPPVAEPSAVESPAAQAPSAAEAPSAHETSQVTEPASHNG